MDLLTITCYTGDHAEMTSRLVDGIADAHQFAGVKGRMFVVEQGVSETMGMFGDQGPLKLATRKIPHNLGFSVGMNLALKEGLQGWEQGRHPYAVLCINNDVEFPSRSWLKSLLEEGKLDDHVAVPTTNYTGQKKQERGGWKDEDAFDLEDTPAVCWMLPWGACGVLSEHAGGEGMQLFREDLGRGWGEDNYAAASLRKHWRPKPFRVVPRAFIYHHGALTSGQIPARTRMESVAKARRLIGKL